MLHKSATCVNYFNGLCENYQKVDIEILFNKTTMLSRSSSRNHYVHMRTNLECVLLVMMVHFLSEICGYVFSCFAMPVLFIETR